MILSSTAIRRSCARSAVAARMRDRVGRRTRGAVAGGRHVGFLHEQPHLFLIHAREIDDAGAALLLDFHDDFQGLLLSDLAMANRSLPAIRSSWSSGAILTLLPPRCSSRRCSTAFFNFGPISGSSKRLSKSRSEPSRYLAGITVAASEVLCDVGILVGGDCDSSQLFPWTRRIYVGTLG